ncbi:MAG TPA: 30S ribosomal protein S17 [Chloroflexota bacterium]|nr:30S ribosomal protein S17 [Chloroflexota bacterium]
MAEKNRKSRTGRVVSEKMEKTVVIAVQRTKTHPLYKKLLRRTTHFMAHDEQGQAHVGDLVRITESRPISKMKHWRVTEVLEHKQQASPVSEVADAGVDAIERKPQPVAAAPAAVTEAPEEEVAEE